MLDDGTNRVGVGWKYARVDRFRRRRFKSDGRNRRVTFVVCCRSNAGSAPMTASGAKRSFADLSKSAKCRYCCESLFGRWDLNSPCLLDFSAASAARQSAVNWSRSNIVVSGFDNKSGLPNSSSGRPLHGAAVAAPSLPMIAGRHKRHSEKAWSPVISRQDTA
jgi:hypothetical protein